jgi:hypothetical protein
MLSSQRIRAKRMARTAVGWLGRRSDTAWWGDPKNLHASWGERTALMVTAIPANSVVLELGAGTGALASLLPPGCRYIPSDLVARTPETKVCDLDARPFPDWSALGVTVTVLSGVLEYVHRIEEAAAWLARTAPLCVVSYCPVNLRFPGERTVKALMRAQNGWVNSLTEREFTSAFQRAGLHGEQFAKWRGHVLYRFER